MQQMRDSALRLYRLTIVVLSAVCSEDCHFGLKVLSSELFSRRNVEGLLAGDVKAKRN